jgi:hypothetical protein
VILLRICGRQPNFRDKINCCKIIDSLPIVIQPRKETSVTIVITTRENSMLETEMTLDAGRKEFEYLIPVVIKLSTMSRQ